MLLLQLHVNRIYAVLLFYWTTMEISVYALLSQTCIIMCYTYVLHNCLRTVLLNKLKLKHTNFHICSHPTCFNPAFILRYYLSLYYFILFYVLCFFLLIYHVMRRDTCNKPHTLRDAVTCRKRNRKEMGNTSREKKIQKDRHIFFYTREHTS